MEGTITARGASLSLAVPPQEKLFVLLAGDVDGTVSVQVSPDGLSSWETARCVGGDLLLWEGARPVGWSLDDHVKNDTPDTVFYRVVADLVSGTLTYSLQEVRGEVIETILTDSRGRPVLQVLDNGGLRVVGDLRVGGVFTEEQPPEAPPEPGA